MTSGPVHAGDNEHAAYQALSEASHSASGRQPGYKSMAAHPHNPGGLQGFSPKHNRVVALQCCMQICDPTLKLCVFVQDTCGIHDTLVAACNLQRYQASTALPHIRLNTACKASD